MKNNKNSSPEKPEVQEMTDQEIQTALKSIQFEFEAEAEFIVTGNKDKIKN